MKAPHEALCIELSMAVLIFSRHSVLTPKNLLFDVGNLLDQNDYDSILHDSDDKGGRMLIYAAAEDQTEILKMLMEHIPYCHKGKFLKRALYPAVLFSAKPTTIQHLKAGVDISNQEESLGNGLYVNLYHMFTH